MSGNGQVLVHAENIVRSYGKGEDEVRALDGITLDILQGEYISLMGPSGSGKTTFFNIIGALDFPTAGTISLGGQELRRMKSAELAWLRCRNIGYIFQNYNLIEVVTALENVALPMRFLGLSEKEAAEKAAGLLETVGLGERTGHLPGELSGGQQQRVAIARALANDPMIILADEPTGNLDTKTATSIVELLSRMSDERGVTVISATHDHRMLSVSDRVVYLRAGKIEQIKNRDELKITIESIND
ncbi:MAG: ABC transporter ATP-binding protein [Oceanipulchritudo sp.]